MIKLLALLLSVFLWTSGCKGLFAPDPAKTSGTGLSDSLGQDSLTCLDSLSNGKPAIIALCSLSEASLSVAGVGGIETSLLRFKVTDSSGIPVRARYVIQFFKSSPDSGGSLLSLMDTTESGYVQCLFKSGTVSGVCAITAKYIENIGQVMAASQVVRLLVSGGPVALQNFSLVPERRNVPYSPGCRVMLTAYVFDKYGNPAAPSMVYFSASAGGVGAGSISDTNGSVSTAFTLAGDVPAGRTSIVTASTRGAGGLLITDADTLMFSGEPVITITHAASPTDTFILPRDGTSALHVSVKDSQGHPLSGGTRIVMTLSGGGELVGNTDITLPDAVSNYTDFEIMARDNGFGPRYVNFLVEVTSPNGNRKSGLWGRVQ